MLLGIDSLLLRERPGEVRYRYLDPSCAGQPDRLAVSQQQQPEYQVDTAIIIENKDTYQAMPSLPNAVCVFGSGFAVARLPRLLPWLCDPHIRVLYWGDIDAAGFEILSGLRAAGLDCTSMLMDRATYEQYEQFGTKLDADNNSIRHVDPKPASSMHLTNEEYALYRDLRSEEALQYPRIEQERIPLQNALAALTALNIDIRA